MQTTQTRALALFSGGLDSILAAKVVAEQGIAVTCLHFVSPFFGGHRVARHWASVYDLDIKAIDIGQDFVDMMAAWPAHGYGKVLNPCVDCKILMLRKARELMEHYGASFLVSGEVIGQRPMSQRKDSMYLIRREADVKHVLLRPLCAQVIDPTPMEESGLVDRSRLLGISGRGRKDQMELAQRYNLKEIPTPGGGCRLAEKENARRYWPVLRYAEKPTVNDMLLADTGRHYRVGRYALSIGRNKADNERLGGLMRDGDIFLKVAVHPGPVVVGRALGAEWDAAVIQDAAAFVASFSPKAVAHGEPVQVRVNRVVNGAECSEGDITVTPARTTPLNWREDDWPTLREEIRAENKRRVNSRFSEATCAVQDE